VLVTSAAGKVTARLEPDDTMRRGVVSMSHGFGGKSGSPVAKLLTTKGSTDRYTRMPQMTAIPVSINAI
jgi:hypothetical protein